MPNRIIKESICISESVDELSWFEEVFFYRLLVNCDDYGCFDARPAILKARLFPLRNVTDKQVADSLDKLASVGIVRLYEYERKPYLQIITWERHQQIRAKKRKFPAFDSTCNQLISDDSKCARNPIQSESNPNPNPNTKRADAREVERAFSMFWEKYPLKVSKPDAEKAFRKISPDKHLLDLILKSIDAWIKSAQWQEENGKFIPYPANWLDKRLWESEVKPATNKNQNFEGVTYTDEQIKSFEADPEEYLKKLQGEEKAR